MKIALDYDKTYTADKVFWDKVIGLAIMYNHDVRIVTTRSSILDRIPEYKLPKALNSSSVIYCDGVAKRFVCTHFADNYKGWVPDIWIDDKPEGVDKNSGATPEILAAWRASPEHDA